MVIPIYYAGFPKPLPEKIFSGICSGLPENVIKKAVSARRWQDAHGIVMCRELLKKALLDFGYPADLNALSYTPYGRPFFPDGPDFNWSHSGNRAVCALGGNSRVGVDIEQIRPIDIEDYKDIFPFPEWEKIRQAKAPLTAFYKTWTAMEAALKANGHGISAGFKDIRKEDGEFVLPGGERWWIHPVSRFEDYACHLATTAKTPDFLYYDYFDILPSNIPT